TTAEVAAVLGRHGAAVFTRDLAVIVPERHAADATELVRLAHLGPVDHAVTARAAAVIGAVRGFLAVLAAAIAALGLGNVGFEHGEERARALAAGATNIRDLTADHRGFGIHRNRDVAVGILRELHQHQLFWWTTNVRGVVAHAQLHGRLH